MRTSLAMALVAITVVVAARAAPPPTTTPPSPYDAALAQRLGADEYGMRKYVVAFLKKGPNRTQTDDEAARLQAAHLANIERLAAAGKLVLAGPFLDDGDVRGIYVFDVDTIEDARALTATDPAIKAGRLAMDLHPWYGSAALREVNALHAKVRKTAP